MLIFAASLAGAAILPGWLSAGRAPVWAAAACILGAWFGAVMFYSSSMALILLASPDHLRGRIMGIWMIVYSTSVPLGALWTGRAAQSWGVASVMKFSALLCALAGLAEWAGVLRSRPNPTGTRPGGPGAGDDRGRSRVPKPG